jgi:hypothetical protein
MRVSAAAICLLALICGANASSAVACSVVISRHSGPAEFRTMAENSVRSATAIIDGEVVRPAIPGRQTALVRPVRLFKGPGRSLFEVGEQDSCSILLDRAGERRRMLLVGGPDIFYLQNDGANGRYEDRLLGSDRRRDWPYRAETQAEPR